jgi:hypothetical protein
VINNPADLKIGQTLSNNHVKRRDVLLSGGSLLAASALMGGAFIPESAGRPTLRRLLQHLALFLPI